MENVSVIDPKHAPHSATDSARSVHGRTPRAAEPRPSIADVLGPEGGAPPPAEPSYRERVGTSVRDALAVLARPHVAGVLVAGLGFLILLLLGYTYAFTPLSEGRTQHTLLQQITSEPTKTYSLAEGKIPPEGSPVAILEIPALHMVDTVVEGSDAKDLRSGPGHMPTTALPGQSGNAVIAGRRATFGAPFGAIGALRRGEVIKVVDGLGTYRYRVKNVVFAQGGRHDVITPTAANRLTLVTASSGFFPTGRLAVIATLDGKPFAGSVEPHFHPGSAELGLSGDPASGVLAVFWCLLFFGLLSLAAWLLRHWSQPVVVILLSVPVLLLVALFACESIVGFLPSTV